MLWISAALLLHAAPEFQTFHAPGYKRPVSGVWYEPGQAASAIPLGALGTGFIDLKSNGTLGDGTTENNWLGPLPIGAASGFTVRVGDYHARMSPGNVEGAEGLRFWGHYPAADVDFGEAFGDTQVYLRAFAPFIPHDYDHSEMPVAFFHFTAVNNATTDVPVELGMQWDASRLAADHADGNVEGALAWHRGTLAPGETWTVAPVIAFQHGGSASSAAKPRGERLDGTPVEECLAFRHGELSDFFLDGYGGFRWETHRRESAVFAGTPNLGQWLWQIGYGNRKAGYGPNRPFELVGGNLALTTTDGVLGIEVRVESAGDNALAVVYAITNRSSANIEDLRFSCAANPDLGGPGHESDDRAEWNADLRGIVFSDRAGDTTVVFSGEPDAYAVRTWPNAHVAMDRGDLTAVHTPQESIRTIGVPNGQVAFVRGGSYALGAQGNGWQFEHDATIALRTAASRTLVPGERADLFLALAWHFPTWQSSDGETLRHRYAAHFSDAGDVLGNALKDAEQIESAIVDWQSTIYAADASPQLKDAVINGLYVLARNSWWLDDGRFFQSESFTGCPITETLVCRFNGSSPLALLFPECEKATMREFARTQADSGQIPFGFGAPAGTQTPMMHLQIPIVSSEYVLLAWRDYTLWKDDGYLREAYPSMKRALQFGMTLDTDGDGLINEAPGSETGFPANQYYDVWPWWGTSAYTASIWLAALKAGMAAAEKQGGEDFAKELQGWFDRGVTAYNDKLWTGRYYRLYSGTDGHVASDTSLTNALCGQWFAYASGLGEFLPHDRIESVIDTVLHSNAKATPFGAVNGVRPDGTVDESFPDHSAVITIGEVWNFCAMAAFAGRESDAMALFNTSYDNIALRQCTPWNISWSLDRTTGAVKWGINYYSNPCVWTLLQAVDPDVYAELGG